MKNAHSLTRRAFLERAMCARQTRCGSGRCHGLRRRRLGSGTREDGGSRRDTGAVRGGFFQALKKIGCADGVSPEPLGRIPAEMTPDEAARLGLQTTLAVMKKAGVSPVAAA